MRPPKMEALRLLMDAIAREQEHQDERGAAVR
jgi:hypothetical protein